MPKIKITERDLTGVIQPSQISNTVFVPIKDEGVAESEVTFRLCNSVAELNSYMTTVQVQNYESNLGYKLCKHLINIGLTVLASVVSSVADIDWENLKDKSLYDVRFITLGDMVDTTGSGMSAALACAAYRGDCTALFSLPLAFNSAAGDGTSGSGGSAQAISEEDDEVISAPATQPVSTVESIKTFFTAANSAVNEYAACFAPNFTSLNSDLAIKTLDINKSVKDPNYDSLVSEGVTDVNKLYYRAVYEAKAQEIPAAFGYLFAYANAIKNNPEWYAIAGFQRGIIPELYDVCYELSTAEMNKLQCREKELYDLDDPEDNVGCAINPIANIRPAGYIIYGNRTYRYNDAAKKTVALSFLNVRNMVSAIKKKLYDASRKFTFEPNNELLWVKFKNYVTPLLEQMQAGNGILAYDFIKLETTAKARLKCRLVIIPVEAVEDFEIEITLTDDLAVIE